MCSLSVLCFIFQLSSFLQKSLFHLKVPVFHGLFHYKVQSISFSLLELTMLLPGMFILLKVLAYEFLSSFL